MLKLSDFDCIVSPLKEYTGSEVKIISFSPKSGGSINHSYEIRTSEGSFFLKTNDPEKFPGMFRSELSGLELIRKNCPLKIPHAIASGHSVKFDFLLTEFVEQGTRRADSMERLAKGIADLHTNKSEKFGLSESNYIATLHQDNDWETAWDDFFIFRRIEPLARLAIDSGRINPSISKRINKLYRLINEIYPQEKPSLLHGDLWSGNYMISSDGTPSIFDPAVYYGHREMDIAMTKLFGGFSNEFYEEYNRQYPLEKNWESRIQISNLYPLFVHLNLFGESYRKEIEQTLASF